MAETSASDARGTGTSRSDEPEPDRNRVSTFIAQVVAELRKVVRPTRQELLTYTSVVIVFVLVIMAYIFGLDQLFTQVVGWVFGGGA